MINILRSSFFRAIGLSLLLAVSPFLGSGPALAVSTSEITAVQTIWTSVGVAGSFTVQPEGDNVMVLVADTIPAANAVGMLLKRDAPPISIVTTSTLWFRTFPPAGSLGSTVKVLAAPYSPATQPISGNVTLLPGNNGIGKVGPGYTGSQTPISASSGNVANASAVATLAAVAAKLTYITGFEVTGGGATAGQCVTGTVTGITTPLAFTKCSPSGVTTEMLPLTVEFNNPIPSSAVNTAVVVTLPALGAGSTNATVTAHGYTE